MKLERVKLHINWLLLLGAGGLSGEEVQVHINLRVGVCSPSGQPLSLPSRLSVGSLGTKTKADTCRILMNTGMGIFRNSLSPTLATHSPACLLQYLNPAHPSSLIKGALLDLLGMLPAVMVELGSSSTSSVFSPVPYPC